MSRLSLPLSDDLVVKLRSFWQTSKRFLVRLAKDFVAHGCQKNAAALTYMTLFAIVPLMTVIYSVFSVVPAFDGVAEQLQEMVFSNFVPETGDEIRSYLEDFSSQARSLTGAGVGMLVITAYLMLTNIEKTFNSIWGVDKSRKGLSSFLLYWAVLSIGPILLGVGFGVNTYLLSLKLVFKEYDLFGFTAFVFRTLPLILTSIAFTLLFAAVPNCRVPMRYAAIGGVITAVCFELLRNLFSALVANSSMKVVYGAFAVVPVFLLWINLVWTIVLGGAILVRTMAERQYAFADGKPTDMVAALKCLALLRHRRATGEGISDGDCYRSGVGVVSWQQLRARFERHKWITATAGGRYVLSRDLRTVTLWDLATITGLKLSELEVRVANPPTSQWFADYLERRMKVATAAKETLGISLEALLLEMAASKPEVNVDAEAEPLEPSAKSQ